MRIGPKIAVAAFMFGAGSALPSGNGPAAMIDGADLERSARLPLLADVAGSPEGLSTDPHPAAARMGAQ